MKNTKGHVAVVAIACREEGEPMRIVLVHSREHEGREPFLKFPGGRRKNGEIPEETAVREVAEETGVKLRMEELTRVAVQYDRPGRGGELYDYYIFLAVVDSLEGLKSEYVEEDDRMLVVLSIPMEELEHFPMRVHPEHWPHVNELKKAAERYAS